MRYKSDTGEITKINGPKAFAAKKGILLQSK